MGGLAVPVSRLHGVGCAARLSRGTKVQVQMSNPKILLEPIAGGKRERASAGHPDTARAGRFRAAGLA